jgi:hypothetical protein
LFAEGAKEASMIISFLLSYMHRRAVQSHFVWEPSLDLSDSQIYSALIPNAHN